MKLDRRTFLAGTVVALGAKLFRWEPPPLPSATGYAGSFLTVSSGNAIWVDDFWGTNERGQYTKVLTEADMEKLWTQLQAESDKPDVIIMSPQGYKDCLEIVG